MHAYWFCLVLTTLAAAQVHVATVDPWRSVLATWGNVVAWAMLAGTMFWQAKRNLANGDSRETAVDEQLLIHLQWLRWSWLAINVVAIAVFGWGAIATSLLGSDYSLTLRAFYLLLPTQVFLLGNWTMEWCWDRYRCALNNSGRAQALRSINQESPDSLRCTATKDEESPEGLCPTAIKDDNTLWKHLLMTGRLHGGWLLIPLGFVLALGDLARLLLGDVQPWQIGLCMMAAIPFVLPYGMQWAWQTKPLHDDRLGNLMRAIGYARLPLRLWPTDSRLATAVVVGVIPGARHLVITDGLRELLSHRQMTMVILHELAHLRRGHMFFRLAAVLPVWVVVGVCHWLWPNEPMAATVGMVGGGVTALVMLRLLSHATEFDADQTACRFAVQLAGSGIPDVPSSLADAARELTSALHALTAGDIRAQRATWLHPSLAQRFFRLHGLAGTSVTT